MLVILGCFALVALGAGLIVRSPRRSWRVWQAALVAGVIAGVLGAGAGGRLVMRLLAATSSSNVDGSFTEAQARIGEITLDGTLGFIVFAGLPAGLLTALVWAIARPPGPLLGLIVLVLFGAFEDPLRADNFDFNLLGPDWLSVLSFTALAVFTGSLVAAVAERLTDAPPIRFGRVAAGVAVLVTAPFFITSVTKILF
jgi:hypothetical protein